MAHQRELIRLAVAAMLVAANTAAGARVSTTRVDPHRKGELPEISVYTLSEEVTSWIAPRELTRKLNLEITGWVAHSTENPVDEAMDALAEQIEATMDADWYLTAILPITAVDPTTDRLTIANHGLGTGAAPANVRTNGTLPAGLDPATEYWVIAVDGSTIQLAGSLEDAFDGTAVDITSSGSGTLQLLLSTASDSILESTSMEVVKGDGASDPLVGIVVLTYAVTYRTNAPVPTGLPALTAASVELKRDGATDATAVYDQFAIPGS